METVEYLSKIQNDMKDAGERLKAIRIKNGIEMKDIANRNDAVRIERGQFVDGRGQPITAKYLIQYAHEIGAKLEPINTTPE